MNSTESFVTRREHIRPPCTVEVQKMQEQFSALWTVYFELGLSVFIKITPRCTLSSSDKQNKQIYF